MSFIAVSILGAATLGAGIYSAESAAGAQEDANRTNAEIAARNQSEQTRLFHEGRGASGTAFFPEYARTTGGEQFEPQFWKDALKVYDSTNALTPEQLLEANRALIAKYGSAQAAADAIGAGIFDGTMDAQTLAELQPVLNARTDLAEAQATAGNEALAETINRIKANQQRRGYRGDTSGNNFLNFSATRDNKTRQAQIRGGAALENASAVAGLKDRNRTIKLGNIDMPYKLSRQAIDLENLPANTVLDQKQRVANYLKSLFNIGPGQSGYTPLPSVQPNANLGQIIGAGVGGALNNFGNYYGNQQLIRQLNSGQINPATRSAVQDSMASGLVSNPYLGSSGGAQYFQVPVSGFEDYGAGLY